jgi:hypothetical protein
MIESKRSRVSSVAFESSRTSANRFRCTSSSETTASLMSAIEFSAAHPRMSPRSPVSIRSTSERSASEAKPCGPTILITWVTPLLSWFRSAVDAPMFAFTSGLLEPPLGKQQTIQTSLPVTVAPGARSTPDPDGSPGAGQRDGSLHVREIKFNWSASPVPRSAPTAVSGPRLLTSTANVAIAPTRTLGVPWPIHVMVTDRSARRVPLRLASAFERPRRDTQAPRSVIAGRGR